MMRKTILACITMSMVYSGFSQPAPSAANNWVDSVINTLSEDEKIAQLMVVRMSAIGPNRKAIFYEKEVTEAVKKYNVGGICLFQGGPVTQANMVNQFQQMAKTPLLICIDGENGLGMRMDSVRGLPRQMMMGAVQNDALIYEYGKWVGEQCKRAGIHVNYAPVVDINNNPGNPVINDRSFGENKHRVARHGIMYMKGMQDVGVMACAKHFPGHGDVTVDSHHDLPVINKTKVQLSDLELYPFEAMFAAGVGSVMIAHLSIPAIDNTANRATSISYKTVTNLLRNEMKYDGLTFTDALEMQGVRKFFPDGKASAESLIAGNDMLCLPGDIPGSIEEVKKAIKAGRISWDQLDARVKKVLHAKYQYGLADMQPIDTKNLADDLNKRTNEITSIIATAAITTLRIQPNLLPVNPTFPANPDPKAKKNKVAYLGVGLYRDNTFAKKMRSNYNADVFYFNYKESTARIARLTASLEVNYDIVIVGVHQYNRFPNNNFGISNATLQLFKQLQKSKKTIILTFGNPYAMKDLCEAPNLIACYEDNDIVHEAAARALAGELVTTGKLPVTVCENLTEGTGIENVSKPDVPKSVVSTRSMAQIKLQNDIDRIAEEAIKQKATPGMKVMAIKDGKIIFNKAYGYTTYDSLLPVNNETIYDLASVTKICATTISVMKLYDEGKLDLKKTLGDYLPWVRGSNKASIRVEDILLHQAGLSAFIPFYKETINPATGVPMEGIFSADSSKTFGVTVSDQMYMNTAWRDTMYKRILQSPVGPKRYVYSDNDFILLGNIIEQISGMPLNAYVYETFYKKLGLTTTGFQPLQKFAQSNIAPTEQEPIFRRQLIQGTVHDPGAAMFGGVAGHAGLFGNAYDLAVLMQMMLNDGSFNGHQFFSPETVALFTKYSSKISRRALGFDKPEKDNAKRKDPYPASLVSSAAYGHTGFTGTCVWVDPQYNLVYIFLSNRVHPDGNNPRLLRSNIRGRIHDAIYRYVKA